MPELPEVESIRLKLAKYIKGHRIEKVELRFAKRFEGDKKSIEGGIVAGVRRFGKVQSIDLDNGWSILIHIKMTGQLIYEGPNLAAQTISEKVTGGVPGKHTHIIFHLDKKGKLYYNDVRKFGWIKVVKTREVEKNKFIANLGPEPFKTLDLHYFSKMLLKSSRPIKVTIMDQTKIGGIGNIYANDALWQAKVDPKKPSRNLNSKEQNDLFEAILYVLQEGIKYGGSSENSYVTPDGAEGNYQNHSLVYGHEGEKCKRCKKETIRKYFLGGRGTYWCKNCQR